MLYVIWAEVVELLLKMNGVTPIESTERILFEKCCASMKPL